MKKVTDFIVNKNKLILLIFLLLSIFCFYLMQKVKVNTDMSKYLPKSSETRVGNDIMNKEFDPLESSNLYIMFEDLDNKEEVLEYLKSVDNVSSVDYDNTSDYNKKNCTLYIVNVDKVSDSKEASATYKEIKNHFKDYKVIYDGSIESSNKPVLPTWIFMLAIGSALIILIIMSDNLVEPFLILYSVGIAVFLNKGSNIMFDSISHVTDGITAILQMALSMDYSIILINRYKQIKKHYKENTKENNKEAMKEALYKSVGSIASSSLTTIVGLLVLVFMSFTIGRDLGIVLAKGVLLSLISIFFCLPGLLLMFDKAIQKTHKKIIVCRFELLSKFTYKFRYVSLIAIVVLFIGSYILKGNLGYLYTEDKVNKIEKTFGKDNQMALIYNNKEEDKVNKYCNSVDTTGKVKKVLCYGNTIGKEVKYNELKEQVNFLGEDIDVEDYVLKILYYNYYNKNNDTTMTFPEFVKFIRTEIYNNKDLSNKVNDNKDSIEKLKYFTYEEEINKKRDINELADIFGINSKDLELLMVYYNSKNTDTKLTLNQFINFVNNKVLTDSKYSKYIDSNSEKDLKLLSKYVNKNDINKKMNSSELANYFDIDKNIVDNLYTYYLIENNIDTKISIKEFIDFTLKYVVNDKTYSKYFNKDTINNLNSLSKFTDKDYINKQVDSESLSKTFNIDEDKVKELLYLYYSDSDTDDSYTILELIKNIKYIKENTNYLDNIDYKQIIYSSEYMNITLSKDTLYNYFDKELIDSIYEAFNLDSNYKLSVSDILTIISKYLPEEDLVKYKEYINNNIKLDKEILNNLSNYIDEDILNNVHNFINKKVEELNNNSTRYTSSELSKLLGIDKKTTNNIYNLIKLVNNDTSDWKLSRYEFVNHLLNNKKYLDNDSINKLQLLNKVMISTNNNTKYNYKELSNILGINTSSIKSIYALYTYKHNGLKLSPNTTVKFVLNHKNDTLLKPYLNSNYIYKLNLVNKIFNSVLSDTKYNYKELSNFLVIDSDKIKLLYGLYDTKNSNNKLTINELTNFIVDDVLNSEYSSSFNSKQRNDIITINGIINSSLNGTKYNKDEMLAILSRLSDNIESNTIDLLYLYFGSYNDYNNNYKLSIEQLVTYLNKDIINDSRFNDFIDSDTKEKIIDSNKRIEDAKEMLVGKNYSRMIIVTRYPNEGKDTFNYISDTRKELKDINDKYLIGNSPMALDISNSFQSELNFITLLTMVSIFIVVAFTFKSVISPMIITLIIQCSVFVTMGILSFSGQPIYFISLLVVQSILMGATIDYGIVYTSYYLEKRKEFSAKEAVGKAYRRSSHTIFTSGCILILVTFIIGIFADGTTSKICMTLSKGTLCSVLLILFILPGVMAALDKVIVRKKSNNN